MRSIERELGISHGAALRYVAKKRSAEDYTKAIQRVVVAPKRQQPAGTWDLGAIRAARDAQMRGRFKLAVRLAESMRTDDAIAVPRNNRTAPSASVTANIAARNDTGQAAKIAKHATESVTIPRTVLRGIHFTLADHAVAIGHVKHSPLDDGTCVDMRLEEWPLEFVEWDESRECLMTTTRDTGERVPIVHGDGQWIIFRYVEEMSWRQMAALLPAAFVFAIHTPAIQDWAASARSHGQAKIIGELPDGTPLLDADGKLTAEADAFLGMLADIVNGAAGASIRPAFSKTDFLANGSTAWQVFHELVLDRTKAATRIYLGTDATLGAAGGAPGVDIATLFGVASTVLQGDFNAIAQGIDTGLLDPWTAINYGDPRHAPRFTYDIADRDADDAAKSESDKLAMFFAAIKEWRDQGFVIDQPTIDRIARSLNLTNVPQLPPAPPAPARVEQTARTLAGSFDESKHSRAADGKFGSGPGSGDGGGDDAPGNAERTKNVASKLVAKTREHDRALEERFDLDKTKRAHADATAEHKRADKALTSAYGSKQARVAGAGYLQAEQDVAAADRALAHAEERGYADRVVNPTRGTTPRQQAEQARERLGSVQKTTPAPTPEQRAAHARADEAAAARDDAGAEARRARQFHRDAPAREKALAQYEATGNRDYAEEYLGLLEEVGVYPDGHPLDTP